MGADQTFRKKNFNETTKVQMWICVEDKVTRKCTTYAETKYDGQKHLLIRESGSHFK
jgi:hypothetical protein